jgi:hypothetical protein
VTPDDLRAAVRAVLDEDWANRLDDLDWLRPRHYQAFAILTMCRALYTLEYGALSTKPVAAAWAQTALGLAWAPLIARALVWRYDHAPDDLTDTLAFIRYTLGRAGGADGAS